MIRCKALVARYNAAGTHMAYDPNEPTGKDNCQSV